MIRKSLFPLMNFVFTVGQSPAVKALNIFLPNTSSTTCPPTYEPEDNTYSLQQYSDARSQCTDACNAAGYCCTLGSGLCNFVPCTTGCHIAWFSSDLAHCKEECAIANDGELNSCSYTWHHELIIDAGFNPAYESYVTKCSGGLDECGCDSESDNVSSNECSNSACEAGCEIAHSNVILQQLFFNGEDTMIDARLGKNEASLLDATSTLSDYVKNTEPFTRDSIQNVLAKFQKHSPLLDVSSDCLIAALNLVDDYETLHGALFLNTKTIGGFQRKSDGDNLEMERAMLVVQQSILDKVYSGTIDNPKGPRSIIGDCALLLIGRYWKTSHYFPGYVEAPSDQTIAYSIPINATMPTYWGNKVCFADEPLTRATGIYLAPGGIASVTVPSEDMVGTGFEIQVGAANADNENKDFHKRMDRVTSSYQINDLVTQIASPLGGGIYIRVPYEMELGVVQITISGGVVQAPIFSMSSVRTTTEAEWNGNLRSAPGVWADFETDKFLMQVPRSWIYDYDYNHMKTLLEGRDMAMDGVSELSGYDPNTRNNYVLYLQPDLHIRAGGYGVGYPQVNTNIVSGSDGPISDQAGKSTHWLVTDPFTTSGAVCLHELGHCTLLNLSIYPGESEATNNYFYTYVMNVKIGKSLDESFMKSFNYPTVHFTIDSAAIDWMVTKNFRDGNPMDNSNTEKDEFRYQHRGYAKYADITQLFGWEALRSFFRQEHLDKIAGIEIPLNDSDDRTYRLSLKAGVDLTPLIHFWGIHPVNRVALSARMEESSLLLSSEVKELLERYLTIIPKDNSAFRKHYKEIWPDQFTGKGSGYWCPSPLFGCGWYNIWIELWDDQHYQKAVGTGQAILNIYWPPPPSAPTSTPTTIELPPISKPETCRNDPSFRADKKKRNCVWIMLKLNRRKKYCKKVDVRASCPISCGVCCANNDIKYTIPNGKKKGCKWIGQGNKNRKKKYCAKNRLKTGCAKTCSTCVNAP